MTETFRHNSDKRRFELVSPAGMALADYVESKGNLLLPHVETDPALRGSGVAGRLMQAVVEHARQSKVKLVPTCPYAVAWFDRNPEARDVLAA
jgi:predicted GNAT family acetyltransferase